MQPPSDPWTRRDERDVRLVALAFLVLGAVWLGSSSRYHGDERYYTDAALRMLASGDGFTPEYADGSARLNKPLATYWVLATSFGLGGVGLVVARLSFLVAGAATVLLTGRLARTLFPAVPRVGLVAAAIAAANVEVFTLARRSTPDVLLVLAVTIAWIGLAAALAARRGSESNGVDASGVDASGAEPSRVDSSRVDSSRADSSRADASAAERARSAGGEARARAAEPAGARQAAWWLWVGAGLAVAVKGALGLLVLGFALGAARILRAHAGLLRPRPVLVAIAIGALGLAPQWLAAREPGGANLFDDQVGDRVAPSVGAAVSLFGRYGDSLLRHTLPWTLLLLLAGLAVLAARARRGATDSANAAGTTNAARVASSARGPDAGRDSREGSRDRHDRAAWLACLAFVVILWIVFSLGNTHRGRYLAPAYPAASCALAFGLLVATRATGASTIVRRVARVLVAVLGVVAALAAVWIAREDFAAAASALAVPVVAFAPVTLLRRRWHAPVVAELAPGESERERDTVGALVRLALVLLALATVAVDGVRAWLDPSPAVPAARFERCDATLGFSAPFRGHLRVASGGRLDPVWLADDVDDARITAHDTILATGAARERLARLGYRLEPCGFVAPNLRGGEILELLRRGGVSARLAERGEPVVLAWRGTPPARR